jgi:hypothetical protein
MLLWVKRDASVDTATLGGRGVYLLEVTVVIDMRGQVDSVSARSTTTPWILISDATFLKSSRYAYPKHIQTSVPRIP